MRADREESGEIGKMEKRRDGRGEKQNMDVFGGQFYGTTRGGRDMDL
jgi:hypothetical protein